MKMAEEKHPQSEESAEVKEEPKQEEKQEEQSSESRIDDKLKELDEQYQKQIAGLHRRNSELENSLKEMQREKMSEKEKAQADLEEAIKKREQIEVESKNYRVGYLKARAINEAGLSSDATEFIHVDIESDDEDILKEEIQKNVAKFKDFLDKTFKTREEYLSKFGKGTPPKGGDSPEKDANDYTEEELANMAKTNPAKLDEIINKQTERASVK